MWFWNGIVEERGRLMGSGSLVSSWYKADSMERKFSGFGGVKPLVCILLIESCFEVLGRLVPSFSSCGRLLGGCGASRASVNGLGNSRCRKGSSVKPTAGSLLRPLVRASLSRGFLELCVSSSPNDEVPWGSLLRFLDLRTHATRKLTTATVATDMQMMMVFAEGFKTILVVGEDGLHGIICNRMMGLSTCSTVIHT